MGYGLVWIFVVWLSCIGLFDANRGDRSTDRHDNAPSERVRVTKAARRRKSSQGKEKNATRATTPRPSPEKARADSRPFALLPPLRHPPTPAPPVIRPEKSAELVRKEKLPLRTLGRYIVDRDHVRVKWSCVNWAGAYLATHVVGGLETRPLQELTRLISELGFNCVRLSYSTQGFITNPLVDDVTLAANPELQGKRFLELFDIVVESITKQGLMVIINNHISVSGWCCNVAQDEGMWYVPRYNESQWIRSLTGMAVRYKDNPLVVAVDLRNEPHDTYEHVITWGDGNNDTDWAMAAKKAGNRVLDVSPDVLIVVSALCFCMDLRPLKHHQIELKYPNRVVYEVHNYIEFQIMTLLTNNFLSWLRWEHIFGLLGLMSLAVTILMRKAWARLGEPSPPEGVMRMTVGFWIGVCNIVAAAVYHFMFRFYTLYCNFYAWSFLKPSRDLHIGLAACFLLSAVWGWCSFRGLLGRKQHYRDHLGEHELSTLVGNAVDRGGRAGSISELHESNNPRAIITQMRPEGIYEGWSGAHAAIRRTVGVDRYDSTPYTHKWDRSLCCGLQIKFVSLLFFILFATIAFCAAFGDSYTYMQLMFDWRFGFALQEGYPYTAPVWLGEFGQNTRGRYWMHLLRYLSVRDVDFAYWTLNGLKLTEGHYDPEGTWHPMTPKWQDETFGLLDADYATIRDPWKLLDLQAIMPSPAGWSADSYPCDRAVLGNACGG